MPKRSKRDTQLQAARDSKRRKSEEGIAGPRSSHPPTDESGSESNDPSFDPDRLLDTDEKKALTEAHIHDWIYALSRDDL